MGKGFCEKHAKTSPGLSEIRGGRMAWSVLGSPGSEALALWLRRRRGHARTRQATQGRHAQARHTQRNRAMRGSRPQFSLSPGDACAFFFFAKRLKFYYVLQKIAKKVA